MSFCCRGSRAGRIRGNTTTEYLLMITTIVVALVAISLSFSNDFTDGVAELARKLEALLSGDNASSTGHTGSGQSPSQPLPPEIPSDEGSIEDIPVPPGDPVDSGDDSYDSGSESDAGQDESNGSSSEGGDSGSSEEDSGEEEEEDEEATCPYTWDATSGRWRDPETGQFVSFEDATGAGC